MEEISPMIRKISLSIREMEKIIYRQTFNHCYTRNNNFFDILIAAAE